MSCIKKFDEIFIFLFFRAELGQSFTRDLTCESIKSLLPHPTSLSNAINNTATKKQEFYAYLRKQAGSSGVSVMIDGTSKSYHYTAIVITYIDDNWYVLVFIYVCYLVQSLIDF